jgi:hypothetical protein
MAVWKHEEIYILERRGADLKIIKKKKNKKKKKKKSRFKQASQAAHFETLNQTGT